MSDQPGEILLSEDDFCAARSLAAAEPMLGTAIAGVRYWLVLEYPGPWGAKALAESGLPGPVKERLATLEHDLGARVQFIKQANQVAGSTIRLYVADAEPTQPALFHFDLADYRDLLEIDLAGLIQGTVAYEERRSDELLFLVCTNGRRDRCCAKWGLPVWAAGHAVAPEACWQTTHIGGHRFAATLVTLPHGLVYGRIEPGEMRSLMAAHNSGKCYRLDRLRGRSAYDPAVQAAEGVLREALDQFDLMGLALDSVSAADTRTRVTFTQGGGRHQVEVVAHSPSVMTPASCGDDKPGAKVTYQLASITSTP
jgi:hypothetical protein